MTKYKVTYVCRKTNEHKTSHCTLSGSRSIVGAISRKFNLPVIEFNSVWCNLGYEGDESGNIKTDVIADVYFEVV